MKTYRRKNREKYNKYQADYKRKNYDKIKIRCKFYQLKYLYGITEEQYLTLLKEQEGLCAICHKYVDGKQMHLDHCHTTKKVRGILCKDCNIVLGIVKDDASLLTNMIEYLRLRGIGEDDRYIVKSRVSDDNSSE